DDPLLRVGSWGTGRLRCAMEIVIALVVLAVVVVAGLAAVGPRSRGGTDPAPPPGGGGGVAVEERPAGEPAGAGAVVVPPEAPAPPVRPSFRDRLAKARSTLSGYLGSIRSRKVDAETWEELEEALIRADVGVATTTRVLDELREV